jgi:hypothetical protein
MDTLKSNLFSGDPKLEAALNFDPSHITQGAVGDHVTKIQTALLSLLTDPPLDIADDETSAGRYGATTAAAVLRYKTENDIVNRAYQTQPDNIVGKMTMKSLDDAMCRLEEESGQDAQIAAGICQIIAHLDVLLSQRRVYLTPELRMRMEAIRVEALKIAAGNWQMDGEVATAYYIGIRHMDENTPQRPRVIFTLGPVVVAGGALTAAQIALIAAIVTLAAILILIEVSPEFRKRAEALKSKILDAASQAIVENVADVDVIDAAVERCRHSVPNPSQECLDALAKFLAKKLEVIATRNALQDAVRFILSNPTNVISIFDVLLVKELTKKLARLMQELKDVVKDVMNQCGCRFLGRV